MCNGLQVRPLLLTGKFVQRHLVAIDLEECGFVRQTRTPAHGVDWALVRDVLISVHDVSIIQLPAERAGLYHSEQQYANEVRAGPYGGRDAHGERRRCSL